ncbi:MAG: hypothetical protein R6V02_03880 [Candidatus Aminicenantes bacterium]
MDGKRTLREAVEEVRKTILKRGLDALTPYPVGDLAGFRGLELAAALKPLRTLHYPYFQFNRHFLPFGRGPEACEAGREDLIRLRLISRF